jgi:hypothetical protein
MHYWERSSYHESSCRTFFQPGQTRRQIPFLGITLRRTLDGAEYADRVRWVADFNAIRTAVDAAIFMTEAKLKVHHGIDMKKSDAGRIAGDSPD